MSWWDIGSTALGGLFGIGGTVMSNAVVSKEAQKNRDWQERMSNTAHQRQVNDLRAAGLNPILSATGGQGASTGAGATAQVADLGASATNAYRAFKTEKDMEFLYSKNEAKYYTSKTLEKLWSYGFIIVTELNFQTARYTSKYALKKELGTKEKTRPAEFFVCSQGIGKAHVDRYATDMAQKGTTYANNHSCKLPRYYKNVCSHILNQ